MAGGDLRLRALALPLSVLAHAKLDDLRDETERQRLVVRKLNRALGVLVLRQRLTERRDAARPRIEPDVTLEAAKCTRFPLR
jgi:hypothetical protein